MGLRELFRKDPTLKKALVWGLVAGLLTAGYTLTLPNRYSSEILVLPKSAGSGGPLAALSVVTGMLGGGGLAGTGEDGYYTDIVQSRWMAKHLLDSTYTFTYKSWYFGTPQARRQTLAAFLKADTPPKRESAFNTIQDWLTATRDLKTGVLYLKVEAPSPELAQELTNRVADLLDQALKTRVQTQGTAKADYAKQRLVRARQEEDQARQALVAYAEAHRNLDTSPDPAVRAQGQALTAELLLRHQVTTSVALGYEQAELDARNTVPVLSRLDEAYLPTIKSGPLRGLLSIASTITILCFYLIFVFRERLGKKFDNYMGISR
jgi:capsule polysaccharide export protein KpsE/RkpR